MVPPLTHSVIPAQAGIWQRYQGSFRLRGDAGLGFDLFEADHEDQNSRASCTCIAPKTGHVLTICTYCPAVRRDKLALIAKKPAGQRV